MWTSTSAVNNVTLLINNADTAGIQSFYGWGLNSKLATAGSTLDLSHTTVAGFAVTSTNALGTAFYSRRPRQRHFKI